MSAVGQTRTFRGCPLHVRFTPNLGRSVGYPGMPEKGQKRSLAAYCNFDGFARAS